MRTPKQWIADFRWSARSGNSYSLRGASPSGQVTLRLSLTDSAGTHAGRPVDLVVRPRDLDDMIKLFTDAKRARDGA